MEAMDFTLNGQPSNRLEVVKDVVGKFVQQRANDKIGLVAFAGRPYLVSPLTQDRAWLGQRITSLKMGQVEDGTAIGSALVSAIAHLKDSQAKSRIIILLTDGVNNKGAANPETSAEAAKALGIKIYTIGAGTNGEAPMPVRDPFGGTQYRRVKVEIDEPMLQKVADLTGGKMFRATDTTSLEKIYEVINQLETTTRKLKKYEEYEELFLWFLLPGLGLLLAGRMLGSNPLAPPPLTSPMEDSSPAIRPPALALRRSGGVSDRGLALHPLRPPPRDRPRQTGASPLPRPPAARASPCVSSG